MLKNLIHFLIIHQAGKMMNFLNKRACKAFVGICLFTLALELLMASLNLIFKASGMQIWEFIRQMKWIPFIAIVIHLIAGKLYAKYDAKKVAMVVIATLALAHIVVAKQIIGMCYVVIVAYSFMVLLVPILIHTHFSQKIGIVFGIVFLLNYNLVTPITGHLIPYIETLKFPMAIRIGLSLCIAIFAFLLMPKTKNEQKSHIKYHKLLMSVPFYCFFIANFLFNIKVTTYSSDRQWHWIFLFAALLLICLAWLFPIGFGWMCNKQKFLQVFVIILVLEILFLPLSFNNPITNNLDGKTMQLVQKILIPLMIIHLYSQNFIKAFTLITLSFWFWFIFQNHVWIYVYIPKADNNSLSYMIILHIVACLLCIVGYWYANRSNKCLN
jgi:hypothetical protein